MSPRRNLTSRRGLLAGAFTGLAAVSAPGPRAQAAGAACGGFPRERFEDYIGIFNTGRSADYGKYYAEDVVLERGDLRLEGRVAILDFYRSFHNSVRQHIDILDYIPNGDRLAVELMASFEVLDDWSHPMAGTMKKGTKRRANTFVHYNLNDDGRFVLIRSARFRIFT